MSFVISDDGKLALLNVAQQVCNLIIGIDNFQSTDFG